MATFPIFQMPVESVKARFQEPFASDAINLKTSGIVPKGIYRGYSPNPQPNYQLFINTDGVSTDSVAVVELPTFHNMTVRTQQQLVLDFSGHTTFPVFVVLRAQYSLTPQPFSGMTDVKLITTQTPIAGDVKVCTVTGIGGLNMPLVDSTLITDRDEVGGIVTQDQFASRMKIAVAEFPSFVFGNYVRTLVHNFGLTNIVAIGGSASLYQSDQGLVHVVAYSTGWAEFSDTSTDWAYLTSTVLSGNQVQITQINARQGCIAFNMAILLYVGVGGTVGGGVPPSPQILVEPLFHNFPNTLVGNSVNQIFNVTNIGTAPLTVSSVAGLAPPFSQVNVVVEPPNGPIPPGGTGTITVTFAPLALGAFADTLVISSDDPDDPNVSIPLTGQGI